jgi:hypothetical protein
MCEAAQASVMTDVRHGFKILTHDWRAPLQGGAPLCDGVLPVELPSVELDTSENECGTKGGYHYSAELHHAASVAGFWSTGRPARCLIVTAAEDAIQRGDKRRSSSVTLDRLCSDAEIQAAMRALVEPWAGEHTDALVAEQWAWYVALGRPEHDADRVEMELKRALEARGLAWTLNRYDNARAARAAWAAWNLARYRELGSLRMAHGLSRRQYAVGIRDAYHHGLAVALPTGKDELGWVMDESTAS